MMPVSWMRWSEFAKNKVSTAVIDPGESYVTNHVFEMAPSGRSKCRGCSRSIEKGTLRFGERMPNPFGDGDMTHWLHPTCAAHRRPDAIAEALAELDYEGDDSDTLNAATSHCRAHPRLQRIGVAERASSGRARCRCCRELIEVDSWRLPLIFFEESAYNTSGFIHSRCASTYCDTDQTWATVACFALDLSAEDLAELQDSL